MSPEEVQGLVHELQVHQIELETQTEELRRAEAELAETRDRYVDLYEFAPVGYLALDGHGVVLEANLAATTMLGRGRQELVAGRLAQWVAAEQRPACHAHLERAGRAGSKEVCEVAFVRPDGAPFIGRLDIVPMAAPPGATAGVARPSWLCPSHGLEAHATPQGLEGRATGGAGLRVTITDVTAQRLAEDELARAHQDWERTFDALPDLIAILDLQHRIVRANRAMAQRLGGEPTAYLGSACYHCVHDLDAPPDGCPHALLLTDGQEHIAEVHEERLGGDFLVSCTPLKDRRGRLIGSVHVARDITERKRAEAALQRAAEELKRSNQDLEHFAYMASHDLQEPVRVISGMMQLLQRRYGPQLDEKARELIAYAVDGAGRMGNMIRDLLAYSRVDRKPKATEPADLDGALAAALATLAPSTAEAGAAITRDPLPRLVVDCGQLEQLFQNLLGNAVKFRKADQPCLIHVGAERRAEGWTVFVRDNGIGIAPEQQGRIFEIFQRLHGQGKYSGTGIGLAICKRIVERQGGRIWVESRPDEGATFCFTIPEATGAKPRESK